MATLSESVLKNLEKLRSDEYTKIINKLVEQRDRWRERYCEEAGKDTSWEYTRKMWDDEEVENVR